LDFLVGFRQGEVNEYQEKEEHEKVGFRWKYELSRDSGVSLEIIDGISLEEDFEYNQVWNCIT
jgi:hypothetical protein